MTIRKTSKPFIGGATLKRDRVPVVAIAGKQCPCRGCGSAISKGEKCFDIPNPRKAFSNSKRFCAGCFKKVLAKTTANIADMEAI